jgi:hypothetical protein
MAVGVADMGSQQMESRHATNEIKSDFPPKRSFDIRLSSVLVYDTFTGLIHNASCYLFWGFLGLTMGILRGTSDSGEHIKRLQSEVTALCPKRLSRSKISEQWQMNSTPTPLTRRIRSS